MKNIDRYGHCVNCHRNLITEKVVDGKVINIFSPDKDETEFLIDDGSRMRVCICKQCKGSIDLSNEEKQSEIMEAVVNGWQLEIDTMISESRKGWDKDKGKSYMKNYSNKKIIVHTDNLTEQVVSKKRKEIIELAESKK